MRVQRNGQTHTLTARETGQVAKAAQQQYGEELRSMGRSEYMATLQGIADGMYGTAEEPSHPDRARLALRSIEGK